MFCALLPAAAQVRPPCWFGSAIVSIHLKGMWGLDPHPSHRLFDPQGHLGVTPCLVWTNLAFCLLGCHSATIGGTGMLSCRLTFVYVPRTVWFCACLVYPIGLCSSRAVDSWRLVYMSVHCLHVCSRFHIRMILLTVE